MMPVPGRIQVLDLSDLSVRSGADRLASLTDTSQQRNYAVVVMYTVFLEQDTRV